jgi:hypothetical protein
MHINVCPVSLTFTIISYALKANLGDLVKCLQKELIKFDQHLVADSRSTERPLAAVFYTVETKSLGSLLSKRGASATTEKIKSKEASAESKKEQETPTKVEKQRPQ